MPICDLLEPEIAAQRPTVDRLPGALLGLDLVPARTVRLSDANMLHGMITELLGIGHLASTARWALVPEPSCSSGWALYITERTPALATAAQRVVAELGRRTVILSTGPARTVPVPTPAWEWSTVRVRTITPVVLRRTEHDAAGVKKKRFRTDLQRLVPTMLENAPVRAGVAAWAQESRFGYRIISEHTRPDAVRLRGKLGRVVGVSGALVLRVCPATRWCLEACQILGLGGRVAYGFGRIIVEDC